MEADKQNESKVEEGEKLDKDGVKPDHYFSETLFKDLNLSEQTQKAVSELGYTTCSEI